MANKHPTWNFQSSFSPFNSLPQYWKRRRKGLKERGRWSKRCWTSSVHFHYPASWLCRLSPSTSLTAISLMIIVYFWYAPLSLSRLPLPSPSLSPLLPHLPLISPCSPLFSSPSPPSLRSLSLKNSNNNHRYVLPVMERLSYKPQTCLQPLRTKHLAYSWWRR